MKLVQSKFSKNRKLVFQITMIIGTVGFIICSFIVVYVWKGYEYRKKVTAIMSNYEGESFIQEDAVIGYSQRPNIVLRHKGAPLYEAYSDNWGARISKGEKTLFKTDILAVGGSYTWGWAIDNDKTYVKKIAGDLKLKSINFGLPAYGTTTSFLSLVKFSHLSPKIIIYGFMPEHIKRSMRPCAGTFFGCLPVAFIDFDKNGAPFIHSPIFNFKKFSEHFEYSIIEHSFGWQDVYWAIYRDYMSITQRGVFEIDKKYLNAIASPHKRHLAMSFLIEKMVNQSRAIGAKIVFVHIPHVPRLFSLEKPDPVPIELTSALKRYIKDDDVFLIDTSPRLHALAKEQGQKALMAYPDTHPSALANSIIGEEIIKILEPTLKVTE